jgi:SnoaL-like domain
MSDLLDRYLACWNATDADARWNLLLEHWADDLTYVDPMAAVRGRDELDATIAAVQQQFPGFVFTPAGPVDAHHDVARFAWGLGPEGAEPIVLGFDVVITDEAGRIRSVVGFLDRVPS